MLFVTDSIINARRDLVAQMTAGKLTREQAYQRALELDPMDAFSMLMVAAERYEAGDRAAAMEYCWRAAGADPMRAESWYKLAAGLPEDSLQLREGLLELAARKSLRDPEAIAHLEEAAKAKQAPNFDDPEAVLAVAAEHLYAKRPSEPEDVSRRLAPHRLIDDVLELGDDGLDPGTVDDILAEGVRCQPLLLGILRGMADGNVDSGPAIYSLALLGEIGDPAVLPEIVECLTVDDDDISNTAFWALRRIAARRPDESLATIRKMVPGAGVEDRMILAIALAVIPDLPGTQDALVSLLDDLATFPKSGRQELFISVAAALDASKGRPGRERAWSLFDSYAAALPRRTRGELREIFKAADEADEPPSPPGEVPPVTVYDFCSGTWGGDDDEDEEEDEVDGEDDNPFDDDDEDEEDDFEEDEDDEDFIPEPVRRPVTPGRNDPCWCGSGKKYKKCHLDSDQKSPPPGAR